MPICTQCGLVTTSYDPEGLCWGCQVRRGDSALSRRQRRPWLTASKALIALCILGEVVYLLTQFRGCSP